MCWTVAGSILPVSRQNEGCGSIVRRELVPRPRTSESGHWRVLIHLDVSAVLENLGPALCLAADEGVELGWRAAGNCENAGLFQFCHHAGIAKDARDLTMDLV